MEHTNGPWKFDIRPAPSCSYLQGAHDTVMEITPEHLPSRADRALIQAAPEMMRVLGIVYLYLRAQKNVDEVLQEVVDVMTLALGPVK